MSADTARHRRRRPSAADRARQFVRSRWALPIIGVAFLVALGMFVATVTGHA
jgi:hypothetical protein